MKKDRADKPRTPRLWQALIPVLALVVSLTLNIVLLGGDPHLPLILASSVAAIVGLLLGRTWSDMEQGIVKGITIALKAILILMVVGIMIGTWIASGVVPYMIYYGLEILSPGVFLFATCVICCVVSLATGSSWTTAGTVGVALIGVGTGLGVPTPMVAGAIVSGSYFGDKMSPLSDSTNLAPAVAGSELFEHIRHMIYTTGPALALALILYGILGFFQGGAESAIGKVIEIQSAIQEHFRLGPVLLLPPILVLFMVIYRIPALPALCGGALLGGVLALLVQDTSMGDVLTSAQAGYTSETGVEAVDTLLTRGGLDSMMWTVSLVLCALSFGGIMERTGLLNAIAEAILKLAKTSGSLIAATVGTCLGMNVIAPDQYLSLIVPGRMYRSAFEKQGLHPKNLSRCLEDAGTISSPLVPWNTCGAYMFGALGVGAFEYLPYAYLNLFVPVISVIYGFTGWTIVGLKVEATKVSGE